MQVRAILFDVFGSVVDWRGSLIGELSAWGAARGLTVDWPALVDAWRGAYRPTEYGPHQARDFGPEEAWDVIAADMLDLAAKVGA